MSKTNTIINPTNEENLIWKKHAFWTALVLSAAGFLVYLLIGGFSFLSGNDDFCISKLINHGDLAISAVGYFYTSLIALIQPLFGNLNMYFIVQFIFCFLSVLAVNFVFLSKLKGKTGLLLSVAYDIAFCSFACIEIRFSYTSIVVCTAGFILMLYGSLCEERKKIGIMQIVLGILLTLAGSQVRYDPVLPMAAIFFTLVVGVLVTNFIKLKKEDNDPKTAIKAVFKKYLKTGIIVIVAAVIVFGSNALSTVLKNNSAGYKEQNDYNTAVSSVIDYETASYYQYQDFFQSLDVKSPSDLTILKKWFIDDEFYTNDKLTQISEFSKDKVRDGIYRKGIISFILRPITDSFTTNSQNGSLMYYMIAFAVTLVLFAALWIFIPKHRAVFLRFGIFILLWIFFIMVTGGFTLNNVLTLPLMLVTLYIASKYNNYQFAITGLLLLAMMALYFYITTLRLWFHTGLAIIYPAFLLIVFALDNENRLDFLPVKDEANNKAGNAKSKKNKNKAAKTKMKKTSSVVPIFMGVFLLGTSVYAGSFVFSNQSYVPSSQSTTQLVEFINNHPELKFAINQTSLFRHYYEPFVLPAEKENTVNYGLWLTKSPYMKSTKERNGITNIFRDSINNPNFRIVLSETTQDNGTTGIQHLDVLKNYYNNHYAPSGETIDLVKTDSAGQYAIVKVVSQPAQQTQQTQ